jgi:hypothetical protein
MRAFYIINKIARVYRKVKYFTIISGVRLQKSGVKGLPNRYFCIIMVYKFKGKATAFFAKEATIVYI